MWPPRWQPYIRRQKYTPYSEEAVAYALKNAVSWKSGPSAAVVGTSAKVAATPAPAAPATAANEVTVQLNLVGLDVTSFDADEPELKTLIANYVGNGASAATLSFQNVTAGATYNAKTLP